MSIVDHHLTAGQSSNEVLEAVSVALTVAGFRIIDVNQNESTVMAEARRKGQWTKDPISVVLTPGGTNQT